MRNSRKDKLEILNRVFNDGDLSGLNNTLKGISGMLFILDDEGEKRHKLNYLGLICQVWNWSDIEIESLKVELNEKYDILFMIT